MSMSKKHYKLFAEAISNISIETERSKFIEFVCPIFRYDNSRFDEDKFKEYIRRLVNKEDLKGLR